ncbi:hypothetical protein [Micromonospora auratinigra]|nr:hypothetical protein [Micromonospora auratinigra]
MFVPKLTAQAASTISGYVRVRDCCKGCDSTGTTRGYCRTTTTRC